MKIRKRVLNPIQTVNAAMERFSSRVQDGIEIYEHECQQTFAMPKRLGREDFAPRLIVAELARAGAPMLTKTRAEISGLNTLLRAIVGVRQPIS